jgi:hypothetical protein|tara:strand:+ start:12685 stop:13320 length:636 start_codon:yes stop_codon:yes gene_type:complete
MAKKSETTKPEGTEVEAVEVQEEAAVEAEPENPAEATHSPLTTEQVSISVTRSDQFSELAGFLGVFDTANLGKVIEFLKKFDIGEMSALLQEVRTMIAITEPLDHSLGIQLRVESSIRLFSIYTRISNNPTDDELSAGLDKMLNTGVLPVVCDLVSLLLNYLKDNDDADEAAINSVLTSSMQKSLDDGGIVWSTIIPVIKAIVALIRLFTK